MDSNEIFNIISIVIPFTMAIGGGLFAKKKYNKMKRRQRDDVQKASEIMSTITTGIALTNHILD